VTKCLSLSFCANGTPNQFFGFNKRDEVSLRMFIVKDESAKLDLNNSKNCRDAAAPAIQCSINGAHEKSGRSVRMEPAMFPLYRLSHSTAMKVCAITATFGLTIAVFMSSSQETARAAEAPISIGFSMSLTGPLAANGRSALLAMKLWQSDVNAKGGCSDAPSSSSTTMTKVILPPSPAFIRSFSTSTRSTSWSEVMRPT
jgi:hypothetical protein